MGLGSLLDEYGSEDEQEGVPLTMTGSTPPSNTTRHADQVALETRRTAHDARCCCEECDGLVTRYSVKHLQTKGVRFRCKLCSEMVSRKADAPLHFLAFHAADLQVFKRSKRPELFEVVQQKRTQEVKKSFRREDVLRKRPADDEVSFGGWAKKEKPMPPPCTMEGYQQHVESVLTAPPWANKAAPVCEGDTEMDREVDRHVCEAQMRRFSRRNTLEVNATTCRCKLCYKTLPSVAQTERHIVETHRSDLEKEMETWHRFLHASSKRQPPFGWVCKICSTFFATDNSVWRHLGKEVFIRGEQRHLDSWHQKEDRWGHQEDEECCGDGMNVGSGLSYESVKKFNEEVMALQNAREVEAMEADQKRKKTTESQSEEEDDDKEKDNAPPSVLGEVKFIDNF